jgi:hypothetical protein
LDNLRMRFICDFIFSQVVERCLVARFPDMT